MTELILKFFTYNLTYIGFNYWSSSGANVVPYALRMGGSLNWLSNCTKLCVFTTWPNLDNLGTYLSGNIETMFNNHSGKGLINIIIETSSDGRNYHSKYITGDISVFADKYDLEILMFPRHPNIIGEIKSLKNLKKLNICDFHNCNCTGSKTDLYNQGVNITRFYV